MSFVPPKKLKPGESPTATEWNALREQVYALGRPTSDGDIGIEQIGYGLQIRDFRQSKLFGRITSKGDGVTAPKSAYGWNQVIDVDGAFVDQPTDIGDAPWGTPTAAPAFEVNGRTDVIIDGTQIVELFPGHQDEAAFYFVWNQRVEIIKIMPGPRNADGDYPGLIQVFNPITDSWTDGDSVWIRDAN